MPLRKEFDEIAGDPTARHADVKKAHWNCHGVCNCHCKFCYGMFVGHPAMRTSDACLLIDKVATGGVHELVFGGGDPSLRSDLDQLVHYAASKGLRVEIQTNAQKLPSQRVSSLHPYVTRWGLSLDSAIEEVHDKVRGKTGNFRKVRQTAELLVSLGAEWNLRTVVSAPTVNNFGDIGEWLSEIGFEGIWYPLEYTPLGDEMGNRPLFEITGNQFMVATHAVEIRYRDAGFQVVTVSDDLRRGIYFLIAPDGAVYNHPPPGEEYTIVGNILRDEFRELVLRLRIDFDLHYARYGSVANGARLRSEH